MSFYIGKDYTL